MFSDAPEVYLVCMSSTSKDSSPEVCVLVHANISVFYWRCTRFQQEFMTGVVFIFIHPFLAALEAAAHKATNAKPKAYVYAIVRY